MPVSPAPSMLARMSSHNIHLRPSMMQTAVSVTPSYSFDKCNHNITPRPTFPPPAFASSTSNLSLLASPRHSPNNPLPRDPPPLLRSVLHPPNEPPIPHLAPHHNPRSGPHPCSTCNTQPPNPHRTSSGRMARQTPTMTRHTPRRPPCPRLPRGTLYWCPLKLHRHVPRRERRFGRHLAAERRPNLHAGI